MLGLGSPLGHRLKVPEGRFPGVIGSVIRAPPSVINVYSRVQSNKCLFEGKKKSILSGVLLAFTSILSGCLVSMLAPFHLVAAATVAAKAVVSSEGFGVGYGWVVSDSQSGALRLPRLRARTFLFVASATLAAKAGVGQAH